MRQGTDAEDRAAEYLLGKGYTVITRRFKARAGEIDLIALDGETLVFVEVKARSGSAAEDAIGGAKLKRIRLAAAQYMRDMGERRPFRYDFVAVGTGAVRHYENALELGDTSLEYVNEEE